MPSRADISFLLLLETIILFRMKACQCPLGLIHHFYLLQVINVQLSIGVSMPSRAYTSFLREVCCGVHTPPHWWVSMPSRAYTSFLREYYEIFRICWRRCQCPLGLIHHFYVPLQKPRFYAVSRACFYRYLSEYSDNSRFSCMLTFWTYLMRCTYPWRWIKYSTKYNRCHLIFSLSW